MSANGSNNFLNIEDANLRVRSGSVHAQGMTIGGITVAASHGLQSVTDTSNTTSNTLQFTNETTAFKATSNIELTSASKIIVDSNVVTEYTGPHDRPLRKYPEILLGGTNNQVLGGYAVTSSSASFPSSGFFNSNVYNEIISNEGWHTDTSTNATIGSVNGHWNKLELPKPVKVSYIEVAARPGYTTTQAPRDFTILGSNNNSDWVTLKVVTGASYQDYVYYRVQVNSDEYYKYLVFSIQSNTGGNSPDSATTVGEIKYYGYEEGDASLDTTLKTVFNVPATTGTQLEVYYDAKGESTVQSPIPDLSPNTNTGAISGHSPTLDSTDGIDSFKFNGSSQYVTGAHGLTTGSDPVHTISLWLNATEMTNYAYAVQLGQGGTSHQQSAIMFYENKISHAHWGSGVLSDVTLAKNVWYHVVAVFTGGNGSDLSKHKIFINGEDGGIGPFPGSTDGAVALTGTQVTLGRNNNHGGSPGNYFNGSIANFRVYSKALNADQVKELYDYQKDYFLGSKSQVTLYKGHLGVGVTEPSGQLELAGDERLQQYPPRSMTNYDMLVDGHGVFCVSASSELNSAQAAWEAFSFNVNDNWVSSNQSGYTYDADAGDDGVYLGTTTTAGIKGEWVQMKTPYKVKIASFNMDSYADADSNRQPKDFTLLGSNDGNVWEPMKTFTNITSGYTGTLRGPHHIVNSTKYYTYFRLVIMAAQDDNDGITAIKSLKFYGTPGPTTLDKGSLSLTRSLDVPRVSRYDVDTETPRPEKLIFDYDTSVNSSPTDISGKGNHGTFYGDAYYSKADKAFKFDGTNDTVYVDRNGSSLNGFPTGDATYTMSCWMKPRVLGTSSAIFYFGSAWTTSQLAGIYFSSGNAINMDVGAYNITTASNILKANEWAHVAIVKRGTGNVNNTHSWGSIYVNGEEVPTTVVNGGGQQGLQTVDNLSIGSNFNGTPGSFGEDFDGCIAKPQIWSVPLENSEIRKLYRLGRTGRSMVISDTAVGIGKAPEAQLDIRGNLKLNGLVMPHIIAGHWTMTGADPSVVAIETNEGNCVTSIANGSGAGEGQNMSGNRGRFTAPVTGLYHFSTSCTMATRATSGYLGTMTQSGGAIQTSWPYTYAEIFDFRSSSNEEQSYSFSKICKMDAGDNITIQTYGPGYIDNSVIIHGSVHLIYAIPRAAW